MKRKFNNLVSMGAMLVFIANLVSGTHCGQSLLYTLLFTVPLTEPGSVLCIVCS